MAEQTLKIRIIAQNLAKGVLGGLGKSLGSGAKAAQGVQMGLGGSILRANLLASAITGGVTTALNVAGGAAQRLVSTFNEARELQLSNISAASSFAAITGQSFEDATTFVDDLNASLAQSAAILPGATSDYTQLARGIIDDLIPAFQRLDGSLDEERLKASLESISSSVGALAAGAGVEATNAGLAIQKLLAGASLAEVRRLQFFELNPALRNELQRRLEELGAESFADLDLASRVQIIQEAGLRFVNEDFRRAAGGSAEGILQGFRSRLFDPQTGMFGVMRDLDAELAGNQTLFGTFTRTLDLIIGNNGLFMRLGDLVSDITGVDDPLVAIDRGLQGFNKFIEDVTGAFDRFIGAGDRDFRNIFGDFRPQAFFTQVSTGLNEAVDFGLEWIESIDWEEAGAAWGESVSQLWSGTIKFLKEIDWIDVLDVILKAIQGVRDFIVSYVNELGNNLLEATGRATLDALSAPDQTLGFSGANLGRQENLPRQFQSGSPVARFSGIQPGDGGLIGGIAMELARKPRRADLVIANTSETILTPQQAQNVISNAAAAGATGGNRPINVYVTANFNRGSFDAEFNEFMARFDGMLRDRIAGSLN